MLTDKLPDQELNKVMAWLAEKMRCPLCGYRYNLGGLRVVPRNTRPLGDVMVHTNCAKCRCSLLFALDVRGSEVFLVGMVTDLTYDDTLKFQTMAPLSTDEVIDWHQFWRSFEGDFREVLN